MEWARTRRDLGSAVVSQGQHSARGVRAIRFGGRRVPMHTTFKSVLNGAQPHRRGFAKAGRKRPGAGRNADDAYLSVRVRSMLPDRTHEPNTDTQEAQAVDFRLPSVDSRATGPRGLVLTLTVLSPSPPSVSFVDRCRLL